MTIQSADIFNISTDEQFRHLAIDIFHYQYLNNNLYRQWVDGLNINYKEVTEIYQIPFLPIQFFKSHSIVSGNEKIQKIFQSSGTTESIPSLHHVSDISLYEQSFNLNFKLTFGIPEQYHILALLPSYLEREGSSLVYMMEHLIKKTNDEHSGFYLHDFGELNHKLHLLKDSPRKTMLWGVSYALLDFCEQFPSSLPKLMLIETGGMKGQRKELIRQQLHHELCNGFGLENISSEYGMTELLSQAYSYGKGLFRTPPWMKVMIRDVYDPFSYCKNGRNGAINIIDLANLNSCSFIMTDDIGIMHENEAFEVLGRIDNSDIRGCNLLYS